MCSALGHCKMFPLSLSLEMDRSGINKKTRSGWEMNQNGVQIQKEEEQMGFKCAVY